MRLSLEDGSAPVASNMTFSNPPAKTQQQPTEELAVLPVPPKAVALGQGEASDRKRKAKKRDLSLPRVPEQPAASGPQLGVMTLAEEHQLWKKLNARVRDDNVRLENLLAQARQLVARHLSGEDVSALITAEIPDELDRQAR